MTVFCPMRLATVIVPFKYQSKRGRKHNSRHEYYVAMLSRPPSVVPTYKIEFSNVYRYRHR